MEYLNPKFSVMVGSPAYASSHERIFGRKCETCGQKFKLDETNEKDERCAACKPLDSLLGHTPAADEPRCACAHATSWHKDGAACVCPGCACKSFVARTHDDPFGA